MRITAKFDGKCFECGKPTRKGTEIEYADKHAYHPACFFDAEEKAESAPASSEAYELADKLGFIEWSRGTEADGLLRRMLLSDRHLKPERREARTKQDASMPTEDEQQLFAGPDWP